jgi:hypothetical protein
MALPNPFENFTNMITDWFKDLQTYVDNLSPVPDGDNSMFPLIGIPYHFDTTVLVSVTVSQFTNYTDSAHGYGYQNIGFSHRLTLINGDLRCTNLQLQGKIATGNPGTWSKLTEAEQTDALEKAQQLLKVGVHNNYPDSKIGFSSYSLGSFGFTVIGHSNTDMHYKYDDKNGEHVNTLYTCSTTKTNNEITDNGDGTISGPFSDISLGGRNFTKTTPTIVLFGNDTNAQDFVSRMQSTNRDIFNHVCVSGATYKIYVGETYLVYVIDNTKVYTFYDLYDGTKTAAQKINDWTPGSPLIKVPTYDEVKYGPEPGPEPYEDDPWSGVSFSGASVGGIGAFAKVYYMTSTELANLRSWMASINVPEGFDPMAQIVSLSQVPVELSGDAPENVVFINSSAVYDPGVTSRAVDSGVATQQSMGLPIKYALGNIDIARRMEERGEPYLDYDCQIELYLPLVGCFSLDTQAVMGRTITAEAVLDPLSGTLAAYAWVEKDGEKLPIAYGSTTIGVDLPVSAQQYSISRAALKQANAQLGTSILSSALTLIAAKASGGKGATSGAKTATGTNGLAAAGIREAGADYMKASQAGNIFGDFMQWGRTIRQLSYGNNTAISGSFGGSTAQWSYPFDAYVKIIRPRFEKPENYNHSQGVPCIKTMTIGECTGFIQCVGVDVSGITRATDLERQAIQAALCNGVYAGGGEE